MGVEDLRRWHWAGIGLVVGLAFGSVQAFYGPDLDTGIVRRLNTQREFEQGLIRRPDARGKINDVVVYPTDPEGRVWMTFRQIRQTGRRIDPNDPQSPLEGIADPVRFDVKEPYKPEAVQVTNASGELTIRDYLSALQEQFPDAQISYKYQWHATPANTMLLYAVGGLVLIGGIWPSIVGLLTGGGIWGPRRKEKEYDLDRFTSGEEPQAATAAELSEAEKARQQQEMEEALMAKLDGFGAKPAGDTGSVDEDAPVPTLTGGKLDAPREVAQSAEENREYKGDFYPVARPGGKKDE
ncbi:MAG TPA: hypothetical protein VGN72_06450 [Tepidisphaeraceae bacterium]|jgi:hypothetical protein|nr:hypothetical protein [Tepidisphaeraceae bacterium]